MMILLAVFQSLMLIRPTCLCLHDVEALLKVARLCHRNVSMVSLTIVDSFDTQFQVHSKLSAICGSSIEVLDLDKIEWEVTIFELITGEERSAKLVHLHISAINLPVSRWDNVVSERSLT